MLNYNPTIPSSGGQSQRPFSPSSAPWRVLVMSLTLLIVCIVIFAGMEFGYTPYLNSEIQKTKDQITTLSKSFSSDQQKELIRIYSQLYNIDKLSKGHQYTSQIFSILEKTISPSVTIKSLNLETVSKTAKIEMTALDFDSVTNQLIALKSDPRIVEATIDSSKRDETKEGVVGKITFVVKVQFADTVFTNAK